MPIIIETNCLVIYVELLIVILLPIIVVVRIIDVKIGVLVPLFIGIDIGSLNLRGLILRLGILIEFLSVLLPF